MSAWVLGRESDKSRMTGGQSACAMTATLANIKLESLHSGMGQILAGL